MKQILLSFVILLLAQAWQAQDFSFDINDYEFNDKALTLPMMDSTGFSTCLHWNHKYVEVAADPVQGVTKAFLIHTLRQVNDVSAVETYNKIYLPLLNSQQKLNVKARVIVNGEAVYKTDESDIKIVEEEGLQFSLIALEKVGPGCYIETITAIGTTVDFEGSETFQDDDPINDAMVCLIMPEKVNLHTKVYNSTATVRDTLIDERRFTYIHPGKVRAFQEEQYCFNDAHYERLEYTLDYVDGTTMKGQQWADMGRNYFDNNFATWDKSKSGVKKMLNELKIAEKTSVAEKIFAIEDYLKRTVQIQPGIETEEVATAVLKKKYSSPFGLNRLYMFAFRMAEIPYEIVGTCERDYKTFDKTFDSGQYFHNIIFYFPTIDSYLDPQSIALRFPVIDNLFLGQDAMRIKTVELGGEVSAVTSIKNVPPNKIDESLMVENYKVNFTNDLSTTTLDYYKSYSGFADQGLRALCYYSTDEDREEALKEIVTGTHKNSKIENVKATNYNLSDFKETSQPFEMTARITGSDMLEFAGDQVILKIGEVIGQQSQLYDEKPRQNPVDLEFTHEYRRVITVILPEGFQYKGLEALRMNFECKRPDGKNYARFISDYKLEGNTLTVNITESYNDLFVPLEAYESFSAVINAAADFNKITLLLEKKS